jgi:hypothetical protein
MNEENQVVSPHFTRRRRQVEQPFDLPAIFTIVFCLREREVVRDRESREDLKGFQQVGAILNRAQSASNLVRPITFEHPS